MAMPAALARALDELQASVEGPAADRLLYSGNRHDAVPRALLFDRRLTPLERNAWQLLRLQVNPDGITAVRTYDHLRPHLAAMPCGAQASHETIARVLSVLRLTRWLSLVQRRRDVASGRLLGNVYVLHEEPLTPFEAMHLDAEYLNLVSQALHHASATVLGVVLNVLLAWPDCCFRSERVIHPRTRDTLAFVPAQFNELELMPKERELIEICKQEKDAGRKTLVYSVYTGTRDTTSRLKSLLEQEGFKVAVLRASVDASRREDWIAEQLDRGIDVLITNPELVKTGLDLLEFPTIVFMQSGYNVCRS